MTTTSNSTNCVIYNMAVAAAQTTPNHKPNQPTFQNFYDSLTPTQLSDYYAQSAIAMTRLAGTTQQQWVSYYNTYMPNILVIMKNKQYPAVYAAVMSMMQTIGK